MRTDCESYIRSTISEYRLKSNDHIKDIEHSIYMYDILS